MSEYNIDFDKSYITNYAVPSMATRVYTKHLMHLFLYDTSGSPINDFPIENIRPYLIPNVKNQIVDVVSTGEGGEYVINIYLDIPQVTEDIMDAEVGVYVTDGDTTQMKCGNINIFSSFESAHAYDLENGIFDHESSEITITPPVLEADGEGVCYVTFKTVSFHNKELMQNLKNVYINCDDPKVRWLDEEPLGEPNGKYTRALLAPIKYQETPMKFTAGTTGRGDYNKPAFLTFKKSQKEEDFDSGTFDGANVEYAIDGIPRDGGDVTLSITVKSSDGSILGDGFPLQVIGLTENGGGDVNELGFNSETQTHDFILHNLKMGTYIMKAKSTSTTATKSFELEVEDHEEYLQDVQEGRFDDTKSTISISPSSIIGDGTSTSTISVTLYSKSQPDRLLIGVTTLEFTSSDTTLGVLSNVSETDGVYTGTFKSNNKVFGATDISFQTNASNKSSKKENLVVNKSKELLYDEDVANGNFDDSKTILELKPSTGLVSGASTDLIVTLYSKSDPTRKLVGVKGLAINGLTIGTAGAMTVDGDNYKFGITNLKHGSNDLSVKTANTTGTKVVKLTVVKNAEELLADDIAGGLFDDAKSGIVSDKSAIEFTKRETGAEVTVTLYAKSDPTQLLAGVTSVELESSGTAQGDITKGVAENGTYKFNIGVPTVEGEQVLKFKTAGGTSTKSVSITYTEKAPPAPEPSEDLFYLTFPERDGALFYAPFPVLYEINRIQDENDGKWKEKPLYEDSKYSDYIETIAYLIDTYPNTLVLESRNGYHLTNEQLLAGEFYKVR